MWRLLVGRPLDPLDPCTRHANAVTPLLFPRHFRDTIFLAVGEVDARAYDGREHFERLRHTIAASLDYYVTHRGRDGIAADCRIALGTNLAVGFMNLAPSTLDAYPNAVCFANRLTFRRVNFHDRMAAQPDAGRTAGASASRAGRWCCCR